MNKEYGEGKKANPLSQKQIDKFHAEVDAIKAKAMREQGKPKLRLASVDGEIV